MPNDLTRRRFLARLPGAVALVATAMVAPVREVYALTTSQASDLVTRLVDDINQVIESGKNGNALYRDFERIFRQYGDVPIIAQSVLGVEWRSASAAQRRAFADAFAGYMARKYGKRFQEFRGARIEVAGARPVRSFYEVRSTAYLRGESPFEVIFLVSDRSGQDRFFNMIIEGVNLRIAESTEIGAMLDRRRGNLDLLIEDLRKAG